MKIFGVLFGVAALVTGGAGAHAGALIVSSSAPVTAQSAAGEALVEVGAEIAAGTRLLVGRAGSGLVTAGTELKFADGCSISLKAGQVFTVGEVSPCEFKAQQQGPINSPPPGDGGISAPLIIGGVVVAGGVVGGIIAATSKSSSRNFPYLSF